MKTLCDVCQTPTLGGSVVGIRLICGGCLTLLKQRPLSKALINAVTYARSADCNCENGHMFCATTEGGPCAVALHEKTRLELVQNYGETIADNIESTIE